MRKFLRISFVTFTIAFILRRYISHNINDITLIIIYFALAILYAIYELSQIKKDDKINHTNTFKNRLLLVIVAGIILILSSVYMNWYYTPIELR